MKQENIITVPNQKIIKVQKSIMSKKPGEFIVYDREIRDEAAKILDAGAFKLWTYLAGNQDGYTFAIGPTDLALNYGMKKKQYGNAIRELEEVGYITHSKGNLYIFRDKL